jgi:hypothetical protein
MIALIPIASYLLLSFLAYREGGGGIRRSLLAGAVLWGGCTVAFTELLSLLDLVSFWPLTLAWSGVCVESVYLLFFARGRKPLVAPELSTDWPAILILPALFLAVLATALLVTALVAPPNNYDSMTYHMARIAHWLQNGSVRFYPTHNPRQLHLAPFAEYAILQFQVLTGGSDRFANAVQWFA